MLTRRGRAVLAGGWVLGVTLAASLAFAVGSGASEPTSRSGQQVVVAPGDTAWSLAAEHLPTRDPRAAVSAIASLNDLESAGRLEPGQVLELPAD